MAELNTCLMKCDRMEYRIKTPVSEEQVRRLRAGDMISIDGLIFTARDAAHERALELARRGETPPFSFEGLAMFHCGPIAQRTDHDWTIISAGPTTSSRMEMFESDFLEKFKVRIIVGKGGMGTKTTEAMRKIGAVYCAFTGGTGALAAAAVRRVTGVEWLDLGMPEALWKMEVERFGPLIVAIDAHGNNLYEVVAANVKENFSRLLKQI